MYARLEQIEPIALELEALAHELWEEIGCYREKAAPYKPDFARILDLNDQGIYRVICLWTDKDELIGALFFFVAPSIHTSRIVATHDGLFVRKDWRFGRGALLLLREFDRVCHALGVSEVYSGHFGGNSMLKLLKKAGYSKIGDECYKVIHPATEVM